MVTIGSRLKEQYHHRYQVFKTDGHKWSAAFKIKVDMVTFKMLKKMYDKTYKI